MKVAQKQAANFQSLYKTLYFTLEKNFIYKTCLYMRAVAVVRSRTFEFLFFQEMKFSGHVCHICWSLTETWRGRCGEVIRAWKQGAGWLLDVTSHAHRKRERNAHPAEKLKRDLFNGVSAQTTTPKFACHLSPRRAQLCKFSNAKIVRAQLT